MSWAVEDSRELYNIPYWGQGYFDINEQGHVSARPDPRRPQQQVDMVELVRRIHDDASLSLPVLIRFSDILHHRVDTLSEAFARASSAASFNGRYTAVYPIKVNQQRSVVEEILRYGGTRVGLECGSKAELLAVMSYSNPQGGVIVCNGYKDREYIRLALIGQLIGFRLYIVIEKPAELGWVIEEAADMGIERPSLGVRVRLNSIGRGNWQNTGGEKSKFGLSADQLLQLLQTLKDANLTHALRMLHCHMGSQIPNIRDIYQGLREAARGYAELWRLGVNIECVNVGGGLGVDYEGTRSRAYCSVNYTVQEYANNVVRAFAEICAECSLPQPDIITEAGRAMTAHHAVLVTNVIHIERTDNHRNNELISDNDPQLLKDLASRLHDVDQHSPLETYHDACHWLAEAQTMYMHGVLDLDQRARAERLYLNICNRLRGKLQPASRTHRSVLDDLTENLADKYFCNFSLFQSLPDAWAIDQIFPVVPLQCLNDRPDRSAVIEDMTCDSDGRVDSYVNADGVASTLPLHQPKPGESYLLGVFMLGAYQEILGDIHNLFGDTHSVHVSLRDDGGCELTQAMHGDSVAGVLRSVHFDVERSLARLRSMIETTSLNAGQKESCFHEIEAGLSGYTYHED